MTSAYGEKLDPFRSIRAVLARKGERQTLEANILPSTIEQTNTLVVKLPNDVIVGDTMRVFFLLALTGGTISPDANRTMVNNIGHAIVKRLVVKMGGFIIYDLNEADIYFFYKDLWQLTKNQQTDEAWQGLHESANIARIRVEAGDAVTTTQPDADIAAAYGKRFCVPLVLDIFKDHLPICKDALLDELTFDLTFNTYGNVVTSTNTAATYKITDLKFECEVARNRDLANEIRQQYNLGVALPFTYVHNFKKILLDKSSPLWNIDINQEMKSLRGILLLFEDESAGKMGLAFGRNPEYYTNPLITGAHITISGLSNQIHLQGLKQYRHWDKAVKGLIPQDWKASELSAINHTTFFTKHFCIWLDFRMTDENRLYGNGMSLRGSTPARSSSGSWDDRDAELLHLSGEGCTTEHTEQPVHERDLLEWTDSHWSRTAR
jgi:hypothetical protein